MVRRLETRLDRIAKEEKLMEQTLDRVGITALKKKGVKPRRPDFPDLKVEQRTAPLSHGVGNGPVKPSAAQHPDAIQFPVGHLHKQGPVLITSTKPEDLQWYGGKKS